MTEYLTDAAEAAHVLATAVLNGSRGDPSIQVVQDLGKRSEVSHIVEIQFDFEFFFNQVDQRNRCNRIPIFYRFLRRRPEFILWQIREYGLENCNQALFCVMHSFSVIV